jgi:hypothetical protein
MSVNLKTIRLSKKQFLGLALLVAVLAGGMVIYWLLRGPGAPQKGKTAARQPSYWMQIEGLQFYGMNRGRRVISIAADRFTIRKGKIGFFSTGLTQTASIENARIDIYAAPPQKRAAVSKSETAEAHPEGDSPEGKRGDNLPAEKWDFGDLFADETFSSLLPTKAISSIEAAPVAVQLHGKNGVMTRIAAASASVRLKDQEIIFAGGVRVSSGDAELTAEQLVFIPRTARFRMDKPFVLKKGPRTIEGTGLTTDLFLRPL